MLLQYVLAGLALGSIYAIAAASLVVTYVSAGVLNFAFGSTAFAVARVFYWARVEQRWSVGLALVFSLLVVAPVLGAALWFVLFRFLRLRSQLVKIVSTIGLSVAIPPVISLIFGNSPIAQAPGLAPTPVHVYHPFGSAVSLDQLIIYGCVLVVLVVGTAVLRATDVGLKVRSMVDSQALTSLSGTSPSLVSLGVWSVTSALTGLAGILVAPTAGLTVGGMTALMAAAFAAVVAARLRSLPGAVLVALLMGLVTEVIQKYLPTNSSFTGAVLPSIPFAVIAVFLLAYVVGGRGANESTGVGGALDRAIRPAGADATAAARSLGTRSALRTVGPVVAVAVAALLPLLTHGYWLGLVALGLAYAVAFLSFTLVTGEGGMIWLCQITFAGVGAIGAAYLVTEHGWAPLPAVLAAALVAVVIGLLVGLLTIRLGDLYVALVTLSFGLLMSTLVFTRPTFYQFGAGQSLSRPSFAAGDRNFAWFALVVFVIAALLIYNLRRSTAGLALSAVRWSDTAARTMGLSVVGMKLLAAAAASFLAAVGGALIAMYNGATAPDSFDVFSGLVWLAVLVTIGIRSTTAALVAGLAFSLLPGYFSNQLHGGWAQLPAILFGLGAILVAVNPDGTLATQARQLEFLVSRVGKQPPPGEPAKPAAGTPPTDAAPVVAETLPAAATPPAAPRTGVTR